MEVWLVWMTDGEWGDPNLADPAHRSREAAMAWCDENRKLEGGNPIQWTRSDEGKSEKVLLDLGRRKQRTTRFYTLQVMKVAD